MKNLNEVFYELNLLYYEYDQFTHKIMVDKNHNKDDIYKEFIKLTYTLTKHNIQFFIDENKDIVIFTKDNFLTRLKQRFQNIISDVKNYNKDIYILNNNNIKNAKNLPLINTIPLLDSINLEGYDALLFTSKNAITHLDEISTSWKTIPAYVIAPQTAKIVKSLGGKLTYTGKAKHGDEFAHEIIELLQDKKVLYVGGERTVSNLVQILNDNKIECIHEAIYKTTCNKYPTKINLPKNSTIIFSSPSTVECFFNNVIWDDSFKLIAIGKTTAKFFPENITPIISDVTSLKGCVQKALSL
jgi:uroporphyrinogen-III synthase